MDDQQVNGNSPGGTEAQDEVQPESVAESVDRTGPTPPAEEESKAEQIRKLLDEGYSFQQIEQDFGFHEATIRKVQRERVKPAAGALARKPEYESTRDEEK